MVKEFQTIWCLRELDAPASETLNQQIKPNSRKHEASGITLYQMVTHESHYSNVVATRSIKHMLTSVLNRYPDNAVYIRPIRFLMFAKIYLFVVMPA